jgi:GNAT superfamily N-acetyltransferase
MSYEIRNATAADAESITSYNSLMAEETEGRPLDPDIIGPGVLALLEDGSKGRYWVAESDGEVVGQIMVTYEWSDWRNGMIWWIQSVYVRPDHRRCGVFSALYRYVESLARTNEAYGLRLYVENANERAIRTYEALGMIDPNYKVIENIFGDSTC